MAFDFHRLTEGTLITDSTVAVYTNAVSTKTYIRLITLCNTGSSDVVVSLYRVPDNVGAVGTAGDKDLIFDTTLTAGQTVLLEAANPGWILEDENDTIQVVADVSSVVSIHIDGGKE